jgi:hypothetical protein
MADDAASETRSGETYRERAGRVRADDAKLLPDVSLRDRHQACGHGRLRLGRHGRKSEEVLCYFDQVFVARRARPRQTRVRTDCRALAPVADSFARQAPRATVRNSLPRHPFMPVNNDSHCNHVPEAS